MHNCQMIRQIQRDYPPYPSDVGIYNYENAQATHQHQQQKHQQQLLHAQHTPNPTSNHKQLHSKAPHLGPHTRPLEINTKMDNQRHPSILKNYKSCPVSPVHEEIDWSRVNGVSSPNQKIVQSTSHRNEKQETMPNKRHSMYSDDAKTILDMIHTNTEKMIAEITQKYGDINVDSKNQPLTNSVHNQNDQLNDENGNFSSDSLEDCSLGLDSNLKFQSMPYKRKSVCRKKHRKNESHSTVPTRSVSDYFIYEEFFLNKNRNVSLSDILNDSNETKADQNFLNTQRHSSASFFLAPERKSQESLLSDEMSVCGASYCNSMESILSDESDCKSAPLEALFTKTKRAMTRASASDYRIDAHCTSSKSYGSSPNNYAGGFDYYYMEQNNANDCHEYGAYNMANYDCESLFSDTSAKNSNRCSPLPPPVEFKNITRSIAVPSSSTFPSFPNAMQTNQHDDFIPRFGSKNDQYTTQPNRSLSKEFATERQVNNSNPLYACDDPNEMQRKTVKPASGSMKPNKLPCDLNKSIPYAGHTNSTETNQCTVKKSCSFEIEMFHNRGRALQQKSAAKKYEQNLEKFEKERRSSSGQIGGTIDMYYVPHKPPVANRRTNSMKSKKNQKSKERLNDEKPSNKRDYKEVTTFSETPRKTIGKILAKQSRDDDCIMDSLELYAKPALHKENSVDSLDEIVSLKDIKLQTMENSSNPSDHKAETTQSIGQPVNFLSPTEIMKIRSIEKKIDVINKLVELEEKKLEQERLAKEERMRPFDCNTKQKGYVKSLTVNFDNLAKTIRYEREMMIRMNECAEMRRNHSLPDVLEGAKYRIDYDLQRSKQRSTENYLDGSGVVGVGLQY